MEKDGQKAQASPYLVYFLWFARMEIQRTGQSINRNFLQIFCCYLFYDVHFIIVDCTQLGAVLEIWDLLHFQISGRYSYLLQL